MANQFSCSLLRGGLLYSMRLQSFSQMSLNSVGSFLNCKLIFQISYKVTIVLCDQKHSQALAGLPVKKFAHRHHLLINLPWTLISECQLPCSKVRKDSLSIIFLFIYLLLTLPMQIKIQNCLDQLQTPS